MGIFQRLSLPLPPITQVMLYAHWSGFTVVKHGTRRRQNCRCFHFGRTCDVGSLGMAHLDAATPGTVEQGDEMLRRWIRLSLCFCRAGNWFRRLRAVPKLSL